MYGTTRSARFLTLALALSLAAAPHLKAADVPGVPPSHRIRLGPFVTPPTRTAGIVVTARINGGPLLRLLLDSGTQYVVLDRKAAARSRCEGAADLDLVGVGASSASVVKQLRAGTVAIGDLTLRDVPLLIAGQKLADGLDGVLPLCIFDEFLIRLDIHGKSLDLLPYPGAPEVSAGAVPALSSNRLLFVKGTVNQTREGHFLLDTGASYTAISRKVAQDLSMPVAFSPRVGLHGGTAEMDAPLLGNSVRMRIGAWEFPPSPVVVVDLSTASRYHNLEVAGLIGYPALCDSVLTVNYRDGLVRIDGR